MNRSARILVAASLVATALMSAAFVLLAPEFVDDPAAQLEAIAAGGAAAKLSALGFALSQLPFLVGVAGLTVWLAPATPRLAVTGGVLAVLGGFGHAVFSGVVMVQVLMAETEPGSAAYARLMRDVESYALLIPFMAAGLLGTVLGVVLLGVAHFRSGQSPRWAGPALWGFVALEFVGTNLSDWAGYAAALLYVAALSAIAVGVVRSPSGATVREWAPSSKSETSSSGSVTSPRSTG